METKGFLALICPSTPGKRYAVSQDAPGGNYSKCSTKVVSSQSPMFVRRDWMDMA